MAKDRQSRELCALDGEGRRTDATLHDEMLDNVEADRLIAETAIKRVLANGLTLQEAEAAFGLPKSARGDR